MDEYPAWSAGRSLAFSEGDLRLTCDVDDGAVVLFGLRLNSDVSGGITGIRCCRPDGHSPHTGGDINGQRQIQCRVELPVAECVWGIGLDGDVSALPV